MTFHQRYAVLEDKFKAQVDEDNVKDPQNPSVYLPNLAPKDQVDFVLVAMEPSTGGGAGELKQGKSFSPKNFTGSVEDFILHFCVKEYLCAGGKTYYLTDLSKGAMRTREAPHKREERWRRWYPLLQEELQLVAKPKAPIIAIGNDPYNFLNRKDIPCLKGPVLHYSLEARGARRKKPSDHPERYCKFRTSVSWDGIEKIVRQVMDAGELQDYIEGTLKRLGRGQRLTESRKKLMFTYKCQFAAILGKPLT